MIIDSHCHLESCYSPPASFLIPYSSSLDSEIKSFFITMSTAAEDWQAQIKLTQKFDYVYCALGIHPWYVTSSSLKDLLALERLMTLNSVVAFGEIGLDFSPAYKEHSTLQIEVFSQQLDLASRVKKPVSIHVIKAHNDVFSLLSEVNVTGAIHGLGASKEVIRRYINLGFKIGVNGVITRDNARRYHELVRYVGLEHLVLETDFPHVKIGPLNSPKLSDIILVAQKVASLLHMPLDKVFRQMAQNTYKLFNLHGTLDDI